MFEIVSRHLNGRFYGSPLHWTNHYQIAFKVSSDLSQTNFPALRKVTEDSIIAFYKAVPCEGTISVKIANNDFSVEGRICTFNTDMVQTLKPVTISFYESMQIGLNLLGPDPEGQIDFSLSIESIYIGAEGRTVPFEELDTEAFIEPTKTERVNLPSREAN